MYQIGLIGVGNLGKALVEGLLHAKWVTPAKITFTTKTEKSAQTIEKNYGLTRAMSNAVLTETSHILLLAAKPKDYRAIIEEIRPRLTKDHIVVSLTPAFPLYQLRELLGPNPQIVRAMPNTPVKYNQGVTGLCYENNASLTSVNLVQSLFEALGTVCLVKEEELALVGTFSGSMPAFFTYYVKAILEYGRREGIDDALVKALVINSLKGTMTMIEKSPESLDNLIARVCSKGGSTLEGIHVFEKNHLDTIVQEGLRVTTKRFKEMEKEHE